MSRKSVKVGGLSQNQLMRRERSVSWNKGRKTVIDTKPYVSRKTGELYVRTTSRTTNYLGIFKLVIIILLVAGLMSFFTHSSQKTFYSFLVMLQDIPDVFPTDKMMEYFSLLDYSHLPAWLEFIFEVAASFLQLLTFILKGAISAIQFLFHCIRWLFM